MDLQVRLAVTSVGNEGTKTEYKSYPSSLSINVALNVRRILLLFTARLADGLFGTHGNFNRLLVKTRSAGRTNGIESPSRRVIYDVAISDVARKASISLNGQVYTEAQKKLAATIRSLREAKGISQERFAQFANIERARYGRIERGELNISMNVLFSLAASLEATPSEILAGIDLSDCQLDSTGSTKEP